MKQLEIVVAKDVYHSLATQEIDFFTVKHSTKIKSFFGSNEPPRNLVVKNGYAKSARSFTADIKFSFASGDRFAIQIGPPKIAAGKPNFEQSVKVIADDIGLKHWQYDSRKLNLKTDSESLAKRVAQLFGVEVKINKKWIQNQTKEYKYIVKQ